MLSLSDSASWSEELRNSWNWRRRFAQLAHSETATCIRYLSEKANLQTIDMCTLPNKSPNAHLRELPTMTFLEADKAESRAHAQEHQLAVDAEMLSNVLDLKPVWPKKLYPLLFTWQDSRGNNECAVFAAVAEETQLAWMLCLRKYLPTVVG
mmetsp:Transcript_103375/g.179391  ORF Transcript_103375/g.179391 Transcript_103375/m.179391 type:complete len:152 (+) Transcript_103375:3-458(+)